MSAQGYDNNRKIEQANRDQYEADKAIRHHAEQAGETHNHNLQNLEKKHDDAQRNLDILEKKAQQEYDATRGAGKRSGSRNRSGSRGKGSGTKNSTVKTETSRLDELREEQKRRFDNFSESTNQAHQSYHGSYGKTSFGTPVHKDGEVKGKGFADMQQNAIMDPVRPGL